MLQARTLPTFLVAALVLSLHTSCSDSDDGSPTAAGPGGTAARTSALDRLDELGLDAYRDLVAGTSFETTLAGDGPLTVVAPTDAALAVLGGWPLGASGFTSPGAAEELVARTVVAGTRFDEATLRAFGSLQTAGGDLIVDVDPSDDALLLDAGRVERVDAESDHATIFVVDAVPTPPLDPLDVLELRSLTVFRALLEATGVDDELRSGTFTVLAPTNGAFAALGQPALDALFDPANVAEAAARARFHLLPGSARASDLVALGTRPSLEGSLAVVDGAAAAGPSVNGATLVFTNAPSTSGVVQRLDAVLAVPPTFDELVLAEGLVAFEGLLFASGVGDDFADAAALTAFVPTDAAFASVPQATLDDLVDPVNVELLRSTMRRHGVPEALPTGALEAGLDLVDLGGVALELIDDGAGGVRVDGSAALVVRDLYATNGVVHLVDAVLLP
ncbi:MAG: fasciclin domain-containing protein [Planctomycetota bacterium]